MTTWPAAVPGNPGSVAGMVDGAAFCAVANCVACARGVTGDLRSCLSKTRKDSRSWFWFRMLDGR